MLRPNPANAGVARNKRIDTLLKLIVNTGREIVNTHLWDRLLCAKSDHPLHEST